MSFTCTHTGRETSTENLEAVSCNFHSYPYLHAQSCMHVKLHTLFADALDVAMFKTRIELFCSSPEILSNAFTYNYTYRGKDPLLFLILSSFKNRFLSVMKCVKPVETILSLLVILFADHVPLINYEGVF